MVASKGIPFLLQHTETPSSHSFHVGQHAHHDTVKEKFSMSNESSIVLGDIHG